MPSDTTGFAPIYPISEEECTAAEEALTEAIDDCASVTSCVHAVIDAIEKMRNGVNRQ